MFFAFRVMVGMGLLMLAGIVVRRVAICVAGARRRGWWLRAHGGHDLRRLGRHAGGLVRDRDRPPAVAGLRRAAHRGGGHAQDPFRIGISLTLYLLLYAVLIAAYISVLFYMASKPQAPGTETAGAGGNLDGT